MSEIIKISFSGLWAISFRHKDICDAVQLQDVLLQLFNNGEHARSDSFNSSSKRYTLKEFETTLQINFSIFRLKHSNWIVLSINDVLLQ